MSAPPAPIEEPAPRKGLERPRPTLRFGFGGVFAPATPPAAGVTSGFGFDVAAGVAIEVHRRVTLWPELGYSLAVREDRSGHFMIAGLAPMFGGPMAQVGLAPRLVAGDAWGATGVGVRSGLVGSFLLNLFTVEVGHQWVRAGGRDLHDGRFMVSVELFTAAKVFLVFAFMGKVMGLKLR